MHESIIRDIWIKKEAFEGLDSSSIFSTDRAMDLNDAYEIWQSANETITECGHDVEKLNQGFLSLKRAYNVASRKLIQHTGINEIQYEGKNGRDFYAVLEHFEITKTMAIKKYVNIRNLIEHDNIKPPSQEECLILSEYIWNYIRNVTGVVERFRDTIYLSGDECQINFEYAVVKIGDASENAKYVPNLKVYADVKKEYVSVIKIPDSVKVSNIDILNFDMLNEMDEKFLYKPNAQMDELDNLIFAGQILNSDSIVDFFKCMVLPEYENLDERTIYEIFS